MQVQCIERRQGREGGGITSNSNRRGVDGRNRLPANGDSYVQWLNGPSEILDAWGCTDATVLTAETAG